MKNFNKIEFLFILTVFLTMFFYGKGMYLLFVLFSILSFILIKFHIRNEIKKIKEDILFNGNFWEHLLIKQAEDLKKCSLSDSDKQKIIRTYNEIDGTPYFKATTAIGYISEKKV